MFTLATHRSIKALHRLSIIPMPPNQLPSCRYRSRDSPCEMMTTLHRDVSGRHASLWVLSSRPICPFPRNSTSTLSLSSNCNPVTLITLLHKNISNSNPKYPQGTE